MVYFNKNFNLYKSISTFIIPVYTGILFLDFKNNKYIEINNSYAYIHEDDSRINLLNDEFLILK